MTGRDLSGEVAQLEREAADALVAARSTGELEEVQSAVLGRRSPLARAHRVLAGLDPDERRAAGKALHEARTRLETLAAERAKALSAAERAAMLERDRLDLTEVTESEVRSALRRGRLHLVDQTRREL